MVGKGLGVRIVEEGRYVPMENLSHLVRNAEALCFAHTDVGEQGAKIAAALRCASTTERGDIAKIAEDQGCVFILVVNLYARNVEGVVSANMAEKSQGVRIVEEHPYANTGAVDLRARSVKVARYANIIA